MLFVAAAFGIPPSFVNTTINKMDNSEFDREESVIQFSYQKPCDWPPLGPLSDIPKEYQDYSVHPYKRRTPEEYNTRVIHHKEVKRLNLLFAEEEKPVITKKHKVNETKAPFRFDSTLFLYVPNE